MTTRFTRIAPVGVLVTLAIFAIVLLAGTVEAKGGPNGRPQAWVDGQLFDGVVTPAHFDPASEPFDELYTCDGVGMFKDGVPLISEAKPGDQDYNGGRWHLNIFIEGASCDGTADSVEDLTLADFESTDLYFECPLLPVRGAGHSG